VWPAKEQLHQAWLQVWNLEKAENSNVETTANGIDFTYIEIGYMYLVKYLRDNVSKKIILTISQRVE
jgi:hypothetical protein